MSRKVIVYENSYNAETNKWDKAESGIGEFHQFGLDLNEDEDGFTNFSVAIVEMPDGNVINPPVNMIRFINDEAEQSGSDDQYYLQDSRDFVGNDMLFWMLGGGYTTDVNQAEIFTRDSALQRHIKRETDIPWPKNYIESITRTVVDVQYVDKEIALHVKNIFSQG